MISRSHQPENWKAGVIFRHETWERDRDAVKRALETEGETNKRYWRFRGCGSQAIVFQAPDDPTRYKIGCKRCHDRFCLPCSQDRARLIAANLRAQLPYEPTRFLTLTLCHTDDPLRDQIERLYKSFYKLRQKPFWSDRVVGGLAFLEVKLGKCGRRWHPHLHVLLRGKYLPQRWISDTWFAITSDSHIVDIRMASDPEHIYKYLAKYVTKGWSRSVYRDHAKLCECINAMKGRRLLVAFGTFSVLQLLKPPDKETWNQLGTLLEVITLAGRGDEWAIVACEALRCPGYVPPLETIPPDE